MAYYKKVKKIKVTLNNVVILKRENLFVKTSTAINSSYSYKSDEEEERKRCVVVKMAEMLQLPSKSQSRELQQQQHNKSLSFRDFVSVLETLNMMQERDPESSSMSFPDSSSAAESKKSKSPSFSKLIGKKTNNKLRFMRKYWSINHEKMIKRIVNGGACVYAIGSGEREGEDEEDTDAVWEEKEGYELCRRRILMGERCKPLNVSGKLQYDETGILLPEDIST